MYFELRSAIDGAFLDGEDALAFRFGATDSRTITVRSSIREYRDCRTIHQASCIAACESSPRQDIVAMFEATLENGPARLPHPLHEFSKSLAEDLLECAERVARSLRWRSGILGCHRPLDSRQFFWSLDGHKWQEAHGLFAERRVEGSPVSRIPTCVHEDVQRLLDDGDLEPIGHELYREAWHESIDNPRSAVVMAMAAAEVGVKQCLITLERKVEWWINTPPTPRLGRILKDYLPKLPKHCTEPNKIPTLKKNLLKMLQKGTKLRNRTAHSRARPPNCGEIVEVLIAVHDLLYILDYYCGHEWALEHLSKATKQELGLE